MARIICDSYIKKDKQLWGDDPHDSFNQRIMAVNNMYGWLYDQGILEKVSFVFKDYAGASHFALDVNDLIPFRQEMEKAGIKDNQLAIRHIFDEHYTPCTYSGAIQPGWTMSSYRSVDGCVGRSWECGLVQHLNTTGIYDVLRVREEQGVKAAVTALFGMFKWFPTLSEEKSAALDTKIRSAAAKTCKSTDTAKDSDKGKDLVL